MKNKKIKIIFILVTMLHIKNALYAQFDPLLTQYMFNELYINPAYAGSKEALSIALFDRAQWTGFDGAPNTATFNFHAPLAENKMGIGISMMHDRIGVSNRGAVFASYAYRLPLATGQFSFGLQAGLTSTNEKLSQLNPNRADDIEFAANTPSTIAPNFGFGMYYYTKKFYAGLSIPRMVQNKINFGSGEILYKENKIEIENFHYFLATGYIFDLTDNVKLKPQMMVRVVKNAPAQMDFNLNALLVEKLWIGAGYRTNSDFNALVGFQFTPQLLATYSYDYSLTALQNYNSGSHELGLNYLFSFNKKKIVTTRYF